MTLILEAKILFQNTCLLNSCAGKKWYHFLMTIQNVRVLVNFRTKQKGKLELAIKLAPEL